MFYPNVSVIIPSLNSRRTLELCLARLMKQSYPKDQTEIIVVDNNSTDDTESFVNTLSRVSYIKCKEKGSYACRNAGILAARGEIIAFTDADCLPKTDWLSNGTKALINSPEVSFVGGAVSFTYKNKTNPNVFEIYDSLFGIPQRENITHNFHSATANFFCRKKVLISQGLFDSNLFSGGDRKFCLLAKNEGHLIKYCPDAIIQHPARQTLSALIKQTKRHLGGHYMEKNCKLSGIGNVSKVYGTPFGGLFTIWFKEKKLSLSQKIKVTILAIFLRIVNFRELLLLVMGKEPERT